MKLCGMKSVFFLLSSRSLNGVPLAYDNIRIVGHQGDIYDDSGYVHMDVMANFIVFQPKKGQKLLVSFEKLWLLIDPI